MSKVQTSQVEVSKNRVKKRKGRGKSTFCILCRRFHPKHAAQEHMHSMLHHKELETLLGANSVHDCQACQTSSTSLQEYAQHISTTQHKIRFKYLVASNVKPISLYRTLSPEIINQICVRNKTLKKEEKKKEKKKKKQKQINAQKRAEKQQATNTNLERLNQVNAWTWEQMQESCQTGSNNAGNFVFQNKENKGSSLHRPPHYREPPLQNQYGKFAGVSGEVDTRTWHQVSVQDHFVHSAQQMTHEDSVSVNNQCSNVTAQHNWQYSGNSAIDFTSDYLSPSGALIFDSNHNGNTGPTQSQQGDQYCSTNSVNPANRSVSTAAKGDVNVNTMLKQIRRALGMREPCRADREAKKQNSDAGVTYHNTLQQTGPEKGYMLCEASTSVQLPQINTPAPVAPAAVCFSNITATAKQKQTTFRMPQKMPQHCEKVTDELSNSRERESQGALHSNTLLSKCTAKTTSTEPNVNINHKVRIAHKPGRAHWAKDAKLKPTINKLLALSGAKGRLSWMGMYNEMKRKRQKEVKGMPRFGIKFVNPLTNQERLTQPQDFDSPLSEGFHWESIPGSPSVPLLTSPPPPQDTTNSNSHREVPSSSHIPEPATSQQSGSSHTETTTLLKMEPNLQNEDGCLKDNDRANKRKANMDGNVSNKERVECGKKKRTKSKKNQNRMDELLAVSLKEDELSHSLQDLDQSLVQARNALQAAYAEVQRLVVLRQQFTAEVNSLRARRIEILQGMQEGYSGASNVTERATTSAGGAAASVQPRHSPLSSSSAFVTSPSQQTAATTSIPPLTQPHPAPLALSAVPLQQEICQPATAVQLVLPPKLFPPLLLPPSHSAAPTATATTTKTVKNDHEEEAGGNLNEAAAETSVPERDQGTSEAVTVVIDDDVGNESDDSVKMMEPSDLVIIKVNESDNEDTPEPPQKSVNVDVSSASTQTTQHMKTERKPLHCLPVKDDSTPAEPVEDEEPSLGAFMNHTGPVHGLQVYDGLLYTCSGDNTARAYSLTNRECKAVFEGHTSKINCLLVSSLPNMTARLYTGSSDQTIRCYSIKSKKCLDQILLPDRVLCLHIAWNILYAGLANGSVASYDIKTLKQLDVFECHGPRGVSCLGTAQEGARRLLLVGSYDSTISVRDAKNSLLLRSLEGHTKTVLCMKVVNDLVFSGSSDTSVHAHNIHTGELIRIYKGHGHAVTSIVILGKVMVTACLDKLIRIYELQSHDRLQVYGGHSDMVMCMDIHKSVIYTGCYDGSIQAVKLNLMKNYRCWWQNCSLIFGMVEHLVQHLVGDHSNPNLQTTRCRWRGCNTFFATQEAVRQTLPEHMKSHVEKDSELQA